MLVAAEASGDKLGAELARALRRRSSADIRFVGVGGDQMAREGVVSPFSIAELSILGIFEGVRAYPRVYRRARETAEIARRERPDVAVLIDSWGFTLRVARRLRRLAPHLPLIKYVGPQVWASRPGRARTLAAAVDLLLSIHAFDLPYFKAAGLPTQFVGNPNLARDVGAADPQRLRDHIGAGASDSILLVLPGSRPSEIIRMTLPFADAARRLKAVHPSLHIVLLVASTVAELVKSQIEVWPAHIRLIEDESLKADAMRAATVALTCSGSVTTELALSGCPIVVAYRLGALTYAVLKRFVTTDYITLFNVAAGEQVAPEFIQGRCTGENLFEAIDQRLRDADLRHRQTEAQYVALKSMGEVGAGDPSDQAAAAILSLIDPDDAEQNRTTISQRRERRRPASASAS